jgi:hypothetical protein
VWLVVNEEANNCSATSRASDDEEEEG